MEPTQLDPTIVNLAKAIRQTESGGDFTAKGKSGEYGAYQYTEPTWQKDSAEAGVNVALKDATPEQQNEVAYKKIKSLKDSGLNVGQIASIWNSGDAQAYTGKFSDGSSAIGTNKYGVKFDVPAYAKSVAAAYQILKAGGQAGVDPSNPSSIAAPQSQQDSIGTSLVKGAGGLFNTFASPLEGIAAIPVQALAKSLGRPDPYAGGIPSAFSAGGAQPTPVTPLNPEAKSGDIAQTASYFLPGSGIASAVGMGALQGAGQAMSQQKSLPEIAGSAALGAGIGGVLGGAAKLVSGAAQYLPQRLARSFLPGLDEKTAQYAVEQGLGSPKTMLAASDENLSKIGSQLGEALKGKGVSYVLPQGNEILNTVANQFPESGLSAQEIADEIRGLVPLKKKLVDKMVSGDISTTELHSLNSAIGNATYKTVFDTPAVKAGKQVGNATYQTISNILKTELPDSAPLFDEYTKELKLNGALMKAVRSGQKARAITLRDLVAFGALSGMTANPLVGLGGVAIEKALVNPTINLKAGGLISNLASPALGIGARGLIPPLVKATQ